MANSLRFSFPGSAWERVLGGSAACSVRRWQSHLGAAKKRHDNRAISGGYNGTNMYQAIELM